MADKPPASISGKKWLKMSVVTPTRVVESISDLMGVLSGAGVEVSPEKNEECTVSGFFPIGNGATGDEEAVQVQAVHDDLQEKMGELFALYRLPMPVLVEEIIDDQDWATSWKKFFLAFEIVPGLIIKPSWEDIDVLPGQQVLEMDPGMAFGTGQHASTRMALELIAEVAVAVPLKRVLDVGTGTGILAMAAALFGAKEVVAIDNDPDAVAAATENVGNNDLAGVITVSGMDLTKVQGSYNLISANIVHDVLVEMAPSLRGLLATGGSLVLAGILRDAQEKNIERVYGELGCVVQQRRYEEEWVSILFSCSPMVEARVVGD